MAIPEIERSLPLVVPACHPERAKRVEGSSHLPSAQKPFGAKILRLRASPLAQDDRFLVRRRDIKRRTRFDFSWQSASPAVQSTARSQGDRKENGLHHRHSLRSPRRCAPRNDVFFLGVPYAEITKTALPRNRQGCRYWVRSLRTQPSARRTYLL